MHPYLQLSIFCCRAIFCYSEDKERHIVELSAASDAEAKASCSSLKFHTIVLAIIADITVSLSKQFVNN